MTDQVTAPFHGVFLDRDGVINKERGHINHVKDFEILPGVIEAIAMLNQKGIKVAILTNQSSIARGTLTEEGLAEIHRHMLENLNKGGANVDLILHAPWLNQPDLEGGVPAYLCDHHDRKPNPGMIIKACKHFNLSSREVCYVGDTPRDQEAARRANVEFFAVRSGKASEFGPDARLYDSLTDLIQCLEVTGHLKQVSSSG